MNMRHELELIADTDQLKHRIFPTLISLFTGEVVERLSDEGQEAVERLANAVMNDFHRLDDSSAELLMSEISCYCNLDQEKFKGRKGVTYIKHEDCILLESGHSRVGFRPHPSGKICVTYRAISQAAHNVAAGQLLLAQQAVEHQCISEQAIANFTVARLSVDFRFNKLFTLM